MYREYSRRGSQSYISKDSFGVRDTYSRIKSYYLPLKKALIEALALALAVWYLGLYN